MIRFVSILGLMLCVVGAGPLDQLDRFAGTWQTQGTFLTTPYSTAGTAAGTSSCAWSNDRQFMICQQNVTLSGKTDHDVTVYSYDDAKQAYRFYNVHAADSTATSITVNGDTITYPFSFTGDGGQTVEIRTTNVWKGSTFYDWRTEYSTDNGATWTPMASGTSQKS
ncbi:MAG TPA: hypothetical protein VGK84_04870 [Candidatus Tumulicola sp.]